MNAHSKGTAVVTAAWSRNASHPRMIRLLVFGALVLAGNSWAQKRSPIADQIAKTYGLDSFDQIEGIRYTFNLDLGKIKVSRSWVWEPKARSPTMGRTRRANP